VLPAHLAIASPGRLLAVQLTVDERSQQRALGTEWAVSAVGVVVLLLTACTATATRPIPITAPSPEGFAIYLLAEEIVTDTILEADLAGLELEVGPVVSLADITAYSKDLHEIELTADAYDRIATLTVPMSGTPFVVCVDRQPVYGGAFWVGYSSMSFNGIVIDVLPAGQQLPLRIQLGYPESVELFSGEDRRSDPRILQSLEKAGRLK